MKIEDISVFGEYKQAENRVTAAFLQICKVGGEDFIRYLTNEIGIQLPSSEIEIHSQTKGVGSVPDGLLRSNFSFNLYVESKIKPNSVDTPQLHNHIAQLKSNSDYLLYLTPDQTKPDELGNTHWSSWLQVINIFNSYLQTSQADNKQLLEFLIEHFNTLLNNLNLLGFSWSLDNQNVIVVAGSWAEGVALNFNYYICQNRRTFQPARYIAFYNSNQIRHLFEIVKPPEDDVILSQHPQFKDYIANAEQDYPGDYRRVFALRFIQDIGPIINDKVDKNGDPCPFTYGQPRYTSLNVLMAATRTSQL